MWVVKLGGSLAADPALKHWLAVLCAHGRGRVVVVPGGGPFADQVREAQSRSGFDDATAHRMAILAMDQFGQMLGGIAPQLTPADSAAEIQRIVAEGGIALWRPAGMTLGNPEIPETWDVTSDSLAAWLARKLAAERLVLVKSCAVPEGEPDAEDLARRGVVDRAFPEFTRGAAFQLVPMSRGQHALLSESLRAR